MVNSTRGSKRHEARRWKANSRERSRMHCLNAALDRLRLDCCTIDCNKDYHADDDTSTTHLGTERQFCCRLIPVDPALCQHSGAHQKLSKIETLRIAINYISSLQKTLDQNTELDIHSFWRLLTRGLSPQTSQLVAASLHLYTQNYPEVSLNHQPEFLDRRQSWVSRWRQSLQSVKSSSLDSAPWNGESSGCVRRKEGVQKSVQWRSEASEHAQWSREPTEHAQWRGESAEHAEWRGGPTEHAQWNGESAEQARWRGASAEYGQWRGESEEQAEWSGRLEGSIQWRGETTIDAQWRCAESQQSSSIDIHQASSW